MDCFTIKHVLLKYAVFLQLVIMANGFSSDTDIVFCGISNLGKFVVDVAMAGCLYVNNSFIYYYLKVSLTQIYRQTQVEFDSR